MADIPTDSQQFGTDGGQGRSPRAPSDPHGQPKRQPRNRKHTPQPMSQVDGTASDSMTHPTASPRSKKASKQRQSVAVEALPAPNGIPSHGDGHKPRPVSLGGGTLPPTTPAKEQAYAGPTFQASPAPSSLPVPKFFSRSVPNIAPPPGLQGRMDGDRTPENSASPEPDVVSPVPRERQQSPLDVFFQADRAEKSRSSSNMLSPELAARPRPPLIEPRHPFQQSRKDNFLRELDGADAEMPSPRSAPSMDRPVPTERSHSSPGQRPPSREQEQREEYTQSLKDLLFNTAGSAPPPSHTPPAHPQQRSQSTAQTPVPDFHTPSPFNRSASGPWSPAPSTEQQTHYSLHYGNRNLSPLFKAAREETPPRPSGLRQELASATATNSGSAGEVPAHARPPPQIDPNSFSRTFLDQQIRAPPPGQTFQASMTNGAPGPQYGAQQQQQQHPGSGASPRNGGSRDIKTMEDDLRRMLKLNVLS